MDEKKKKDEINLNEKWNNYIKNKFKPLDWIGEEIESFKSGCFFWTAQIFTWIFLVTFVTLLLLGYESFKLFLILFIFSYIPYIIMEFRSSTAKILWNIISKEDVKEMIRKYFATPPKILINCQSFHTETGYISRVNSTTGYTKTESYEYPVVTNSKILDFPYYSARDVSGLFYLIDKASAGNKSYVKLELIEDINFADEISYMDYIYEKNIFIEMNKNLDKELNTKESRIIPFMINNTIIKIDNSFSLMIPLFVFLTLLTLAELYKPCIKSFYYEQQFKIRKLISTRYDLNQPEFNTKYQKINPRVIVDAQTFDFRPEDYNYLNNDCQVNQPIKEELEMAEIFKDKIPEYQILNNGVIFDNTIKGNNNINSGNNRGGIDLPLIQTG